MRTANGTNQPEGMHVGIHVGVHVGVCTGHPGGMHACGYVQGTWGHVMWVRARHLGACMWHACGYMQNTWRRTCDLMMQWGICVTSLRGIHEDHPGVSM